jgi:L-aminopeptidase/D-esterase-like protein
MEAWPGSPVGAGAGMRAVAAPGPCGDAELSAAGVHPAATRSVVVESRTVESMTVRDVVAARSRRRPRFAVTGESWSSEKTMVSAPCPENESF